MNRQTLLTFTLQGLRLAIDTTVVREIIWLPELTLVEECPDFIAGVINIRGKIVPVLDLQSRFGHQRQPYSPADRVIILALAEGDAETSAPPAESAAHASLQPLGIIVNDVLDVLEIPAEDMEPPPFAAGNRWPQARFVRGEAKAGDEIFMILDARKILETEFLPNEAEGEKPAVIPPAAADYFCPEAGPLARETFHGRAVALRQLLESNDPALAKAVAVVSLNGEWLGVELEAVREFAKIHNFTPVPCSPRHIAGNMNLRGNVLTVVDIRGLLNMSNGKINGLSRVVVVDLGGFALGLVVDEIIDVITLRETEVVAVPAAIKALEEKFVKGAAPFAGRIMALLDLPALLAWEGLLVNEEV